MPESFDRLTNLEVLQLNENLLDFIDCKLSNMQKLRKLYLHENRLNMLPRDISNLVNLDDFSLEWFVYTKPATSKIQTNPEVIRSIRDFLSNFKFHPDFDTQRPISPQPGGINQKRLPDSKPQEKKDFRNQRSIKNDNYVSFCDFIIHYHKLPHNDLEQVNKVLFTMKKRTLIHQICQNTHIHLLKNIVDFRQKDGDFGSDE